MPSALKGSGPVSSSGANSSDNTAPPTQSKLSKDETGRDNCLTAIVIPARLESNRLPKKLLLTTSGEPLINYPLRNALAADRAADVGLVTDSYEIMSSVRRDFPAGLLRHFSPDEVSCGSLRIGQWMKKFDAWDTYHVVVNLQADEPTIDPKDLDSLIAACQYTETICTLVTELKPAQRSDHSAVKAWMRGNAIQDFSRAMLSKYAEKTVRHHIGVYAIPRKWFMAVFTDRRSPRSESMSLEQLTWLDGGLKIIGVELKNTPVPIQVNTQKDYDQFCDWVKQRQQV